MFWFKIWVSSVITHFGVWFHSEDVLEMEKLVPTWLVKLNLFGSVKFQALWFPAVAQTYKYQVDWRFIIIQIVVLLCLLVSVRILSYMVSEKGHVVPQTSSAH